MAETKIIPWDLRDLILSHIFGSFLGYRMSPERQSFSGVVPLDISEVRRTQRRVAALLGQTPPEFYSTKPVNRLSDDSHPYSQLQSIRRLLDNGRRDKLHPLMPPVPQNSFLGFDDENVDKNNNDDADEKGDLFDTAFFHEDTDPNEFRLPSVFATPMQGKEGVRRRHNRLVPTVSERSFVNSNLRQYRKQSGHSPSLPRINSNSVDLVSMTSQDYRDLDDMEPDRTRRPPRGKGPGKSREGNGGTPGGGSREEVMTSEMMRMMTLESERTGGSLRMDESFVPMSVTVTKLATGQRPGREYDLSSSISGSLSVSRETSLASSDLITDDALRSSSCLCAEPQPQMLPSKYACPECLKLGTHEDWCSCNGLTEKVTLTCMTCGKTIRKQKQHRRRPKGATNRKSSGSAHERHPHPVTPETAMAKLNSSSTELPDRQQFSGKEKDQRTRRSSKNNESHVRFDNQVTHVFPDQNGQDLRSSIKYSSLKEEESDNNLVKPRKSERDKKLFVKRQPQLVSESVHIDNLGVSVHKMAYDMALRDARMSGAYKKKGKKSKALQLGDFGGNGTMFSYFPLLKRQRPFSESDRLEIGLRAQEGTRVKPKDYMKHIFGSVKLADYYPGGKKWKGR